MTGCGETSGWASASTRAWPWWGIRAATRSSNMVRSGILSIWRSRVEGATKHLGVSLLITGSTRELLGRDFATRRLCRARVVGIAGEVDLHELHGESASTDWQSRRESYERALVLYETGKWSEACQTLFPLLNGDEGTYDLPSLTLAGPGRGVPQGPSIDLRPDPRAKI